jgi:RNA polymerase sigma factor FliA
MRDMLSCVRRVVWKMRPAIPAQVETDDLVGDGCLGLVDAQRKFDPRKNPNFEIYARCRIRGAILDGLRAADPRSRLMRKRGDQLEFENPDSALPNVPSSTESPFDYCYRRQRRRVLARALGRMLKRHRRIILLHYFRDVPFARIALRMRVDPSRVSQLHAEAITALRRRIRPALSFGPRKKCATYAGGPMESEVTKP